MREKGIMPVVKQRSPWGVYLLQFTVIYYFVWYVKVNNELTRIHGLSKVGPVSMVIGQCTPIANWVGLAHTSRRMSQAEARVGVPPSTSAGMMFWSSIWFRSHVRYLQRRVNQLGLELEQRDANAALALAQPKARPGAWVDELASFDVKDDEA